MNVYIATAFASGPLAAEVADLLEANGHHITRRWWLDSSERYAEDLAYRAECAANDRAAVDESDALILLAHPSAYGAMVELGMALASGTPVLVVSPERRDCVFYHLPEVAFAEAPFDALDWLDRVWTMGS